MTLEERIESFAALGEILRDNLNNIYNTGGTVMNVGDNYGTSRDWYLLNALINNQYLHNPWFTPENVRFALLSVANELTKYNLIKWTSSYPSLKGPVIPLKTGVIMAGNIPLVGFHDFLSVLLSGNNLIAKTSSKDSELLVHIAEILCSVNPGFNEKIFFTKEPLSDFDVIIATGSDNSSRYFEHYFGRYPNIIRKNRNSVAIIEGDESDSELEALGNDIFLYFGLGCRNVSKLFLPDGYDLSVLTNHWQKYSSIINNVKYANNYDFNKAVYIVNREPFHDTGYLLMKEEKKLSSPVSVLFYEFYKSQSAVRQQTELLKDKIQCIVGRNNIPFGKAQSPNLWDYADGIDTIEFLLKKKLPGIL